MSSPLAYLNGRFLSFREAALPLADAGFAFGATIVDNVRTFRHRLFRWPDHLARFRKHCEECYVPLPATDAELTAVAEELVRHNAKLLPPGGELQLVAFATPGPLGLYYGEAANGPPTWGMHTYPLPFARFRRFFTEGVVLAVAGIQASDSADILPPSIKHRSRLSWWLAGQKLLDPESIFHRPDGVPVVMIHDGCGDTAIGSILAVCDGAVIAPEFGMTLDSISVLVVGELCEQIGIRFDRAPLDMRGLYGAEKIVAGDAMLESISEVMLAGTGFCLAGVREFAAGRRSRKYAWPGPVYRKLLAAWSDLVGVDIVAQMEVP